MTTLPKRFLLDLDEDEFDMLMMLVGLASAQMTGQVPSVIMMVHTISRSHNAASRLHALIKKLTPMVEASIQL